MTSIYRRVVVAGMLASSLVLSVGAMPVQAAGTFGSTLQTGLTAAAPDALKGGQTDLGKIIGALIQSVIGFLGAVLLVYLLYAGFLWMTAGGDEKKVSQAKDIIKNAVIGLVIIAAAYAISNFVIQSLGNVTSGAANGPPPVK